MNRREFIAGTAAASAALAMPLSAIPSAAETPLEAVMFCTSDEPWGVWVPGHVSKERYYDAALRMLEKDRDFRDMAEDWFFDHGWTEDGDIGERFIREEPEHRYMHVIRENDPELGTVYNLCQASDEGAIPITVVMY